MLEVDLSVGPASRTRRLLSSQWSLRVSKIKMRKSSTWMS